MSNQEQLAVFLGEEKAKEVLKITDSYDKYVNRMKSKLNKLLEPVGYEVKTGVAFTKKETK